MIPEGPIFLVLDSRAALLSLGNRQDDVSMLDKDWDRYIMEADGSAEHCCKQVNNNEYGIGCVVSNENGVIQWRWFQENGKWKVIDNR
jgi:hypothetical protein